MNDFDLPFFAGSCEDLTECGIDTEPLRKSQNGERAIIHMHNLSMEQFNSIRVNTDIEALTHEQAKTGWA